MDKEFMTCWEKAGERLSYYIKLFKVDLEHNACNCEGCYQQTIAVDLFWLRNHFDVIWHD